MSHRMKIAGVGLLVMTTMGALAAMNASATTGGHFVSEVQHTLVNQTSSPNSPHQLEFTLHGLAGGFTCDEAIAVGTANSSTVTEAMGSLLLNKCHTTGSEVQTSVFINGCETRLTIASGNPATTEQTDDLVCPPGKAIEIKHPNCTITIPPQNNISGFTYTSVVENGKHAVTVDVNVQISLQYHAGLCIFTGTNHTGTIIGSTIVRAIDTEGNPVGVTPT